MRRQFFSIGSRGTRRLVLALFFLLRVYFVFQPSYLHPDEHMQGPQMIAQGIFGWPAQIPWEFSSDRPIRSYLPLWLLYGFPMSLFNRTSNPKNVFLVLRIFQVLLIYILEDMAVDRLSVGSSEKLRALFFIGTSYVTLVYQSHTLSNSIETILVLWYLVILRDLSTRRKSPVDSLCDSVLLGALSTFGIFNRPSFLCWTLLPSIILLRILCQNLWMVITFCGSVVVTGFIFIYADSLLYDSDSWVFAPLNNVFYNTSVSHLALHGIHPRWTHLLVNVPLLLGPGLLMVKPKLSLTCISAISGLLFLSVIPHQEARFLLPLVPLLCLHMDISRFSKKISTVIFTSWLLFNLIMSIIMGKYHQAGVIPALEYVKSSFIPCTTIWWKTYPPPLWLLGSTFPKLTYLQINDTNVNDMVMLAESASFHNDLTVLDLMGTSIDNLQKVISAASVSHTLLVTPRNKHLNLGSQPIWSATAHISFDNIDISDWSSLYTGLGIWEFDANDSQRLFL